MKIFTTKGTEKTNRLTFENVGGLAFLRYFLDRIVGVFLSGGGSGNPDPIACFCFLSAGRTGGDAGFLADSALFALECCAGAALGTAAGVLTAVLISVSKVMSCLLRPVLAAAKATPVASFIILALVWISRVYVPSFIGGLIVFPVVCGNVAQGLRETQIVRFWKKHRFSVSANGGCFYMWCAGNFSVFSFGHGDFLGLGLESRYCGRGTLYA